MSNPQLDARTNPPTPPTDVPDHHPDSTHDPLPSSTIHRTATPSSLNQSGSEAPATKHSHIWLITGPAGCGKTTVAKYIANALALPYLEGDDFHPPSNVEKMRSGHPLTDEDRWAWLETLRDASVGKLHEGNPGVIVTCSALKRRYRDVLRVAAYWDTDVKVHFLWLSARESVLAERVAMRKGHYMGKGMVRSQFETLEEPDSEPDTVKVDVEGPVEEVEKTALARVRAVVEGHVRKDQQ
jgi:gluconokinase